MTNRRRGLMEDKAVARDKAKAGRKGFLIPGTDVPTDLFQSEICGCKGQEER